ncbi:MAG: heme biosynthesis protein HemY [Rhodoglobus sp.]
MAKTAEPSLSSNEGRAAHFRTLPEHVDLADTVATQDSAPPPDPSMGRDADLAWLLRTAG